MTDLGKRRAENKYVINIDKEINRSSECKI